jgi:hypothetical protein
MLRLTIPTDWSVDNASRRAISAAFASSCALISAAITRASSSIARSSSWIQNKREKMEWNRREVNE